MSDSLNSLGSRVKNHHTRVMVFLSFSILAFSLASFFFLIGVYLIYNIILVVLEKTLESPLDCKEIQPVHPKGNHSWILFGRTGADSPILKPPDAVKDWRQEEKRMTEDEMVGWHHQLNGHEFEQAPGDGDGQGSLACCSPWGCKTWTRLSNWTELISFTTLWFNSFIDFTPFKVKVLVIQSCPTPRTVAHQLLCPWNSPGKNIGVGCPALLQGIFLTQGLNPGLLHCRQILYHLSHQGSPIYSIKVILKYWLCFLCWALHPWLLLTFYLVVSTSCLLIPCLFF